MEKFTSICILIYVSVMLYPAHQAFAQKTDWRNIENGWIIPDETYSDQPYIVKTEDGAWLCVMTTGAGAEGSNGQHIITQRSLDQGKTWQDKVAVEPADGPEASYAVFLQVPSGRIYVFYNHNTDNLRAVKADDPPFEGGMCKRVDSQGHFVYKYSDDQGKTWSQKRYEIPQRDFDIDRENPYGGEIKFFWNVGKPFQHKGAGYVPIHKVGGFGYGFFTRNEGALLMSNNILTESDPEKIRWETLPDGDVGLRTPVGGGPIAAEQSYSVLSDGSMYCVYRSVDGHPVYTYSRDDGHNWEAPKYKTYANGRLMKHPRAANFAWKCSNGKYLYWFHNHGGKSFDDRNPVWISGGIEADSPNGKIIQWSQPEILLYDEDPFIRMSYPDLIEENGEFYITETQKDVARVHLLDTDLLAGLWNQFENKSLTKEGLILNWKKGDSIPIAAPQLPQLVSRDHSRADHGTKHTEASFTIEVQFELENLDAGQFLCDARKPDGQGWSLRVTEDQTLEFTMHDGRTKQSWACDMGMLKTQTSHHVSIIVDGGPHLILFVLDGVLQDGGTQRQFGWGRFSPDFRSANGAGTIELSGNSDARIDRLRIYDRYLTVSEAIGNYHHALLNRP